MTQAAAQGKPRMVITPAPGSVLDQLLHREAAAEAAAKEADELLKSARDGIKAALSQAHPGITQFDITGSATRPAKTMRWVETVSLDAKRLKEERPVLYVEYAKFGGRWELRPAREL